jgi:exodeoxyribonuclease VII large subunit
MGSSGDTFDLPLLEPREVFTVSSLNREARVLIEDHLGVVWVEGEISNLARPSSGHLYWSLKDEQAQVRCAMFRQSNRLLRFAPDNGQQVLLRGRVSLYEARGEFQLVVEYMEEAGEGILRRRFEELKRRLAAEGLFDPDRKKALPRLPRRIGIVTSPSGAAVRDVLTVLRRRFPAVPVLIYPTAVQGEAAAEEIARTLALADRRGECDLLILARGGGSLEDLWSFNEETVARALAALSTPVIVGVGHEVDFTIADFVADLRAPTPSGAAELAVPDQADWRERLARLGDRLSRAAKHRLADPGRTLDALAHRLSRTHPGVQLRQSSQRLDELEARLKIRLDQALGQRRARLAELTAALLGTTPRHQLARLAERLHWGTRELHRAMRESLARRQRHLTLAERTLRSVSPIGTLARGYAIVTTAAAGSVVTDARAAPPGTGIEIRLTRGGLSATVDEAHAGGEEAT